MSVSFNVTVSQKTKVLIIYFLGQFGRRLCSRVPSPPSRSPGHGGSYNCQVEYDASVPFQRVLTRTSFRQNWLEENHVIGRLLKPHTTNTIFINFAARNTLVAEEDSGVQSMFSVFSVFPWTFPLFFPKGVFSLFFCKYDNQWFLFAGWKGRGNATDIRGNVATLLLAKRIIPYNDGGKGISPK